MHEHQTTTRERVTILLAEIPLGRRTYMRKHEFRLRFAGQSLEVYAVPGGDRGGEDGGLRTEYGERVEADAEAIAVVRAACVEAETGVVGLRENAVGG